MRGDKGKGNEDLRPTVMISVSLTLFLTVTLTSGTLGEKGPNSDGAWMRVRVRVFFPSVRSVRVILGLGSVSGIQDGVIHYWLQCINPVRMYCSAEAELLIAYKIDS